MLAQREERVRLYFWRIAIVSLIVSGCVALSLGFSYAASVDTSSLVLAQAAAPPATLLQINSDPFTNTDSNHKTQVEPGSFAFGNTIVTAMQSGRFFDGGASDIAFSTSTDGGRTWSKGTLPGVTVNSTPPGPYARASDPTVAYDLRHNVWLISYLGIKTPNNADVVVSRSTDGGKSFGAPVVISAQGTDLLDKNWTTCDDHPGSPFFGHCYTEFDNFTQLNLVQVSTSTNGGASWGRPQTTPDQTCVIGGQPVTQPNGTVVMPIADCFNGTIMSIRSLDGGDSWTEPAFVGQAIFFGAAGNLRAPNLPSANVDGSGRVYVTWQDCRMEARCTTGADDLILSSSTDGFNWSVPRRIPIAPLGSTVEPTLPGLGVDQTTGGDSAHLGLVYYFIPNQVINGNFCTPDSCQLEVGFISSTNSGRTWSAPRTLAGPMSLHWLPLTTQGFMVGDYFATSIIPQGFRDSSVALPIFMVASPPTPPSTTCSNEKTGAPGQNCNEPTFTVGGGIGIGVGGGPEAVEAPAITSAEAVASPSGAVQRLQIPERDHSGRGQTAN
jgi:hypothetical protein